MVLPRILALYNIMLCMSRILALYIQVCYACVGSVHMDVVGISRLVCYTHSHVYTQLERAGKLVM